MIRLIEKPDFVSYDTIHEVLYAAHSKNRKMGLYVKDEFILEAKARLVSSAKIKKQCHARKYTSTFYVFKKDEKLFKKNSIFKLLEMCEEQDKNGTLEGKVWPFK